MVLEVDGGDILDFVKLSCGYMLASQPANHHWQGNTREFCVKALLKWIIDKEGTIPKWDMETGWTIEI